MPGRFNFNAQHVALTLLALLMSAVLGATIPMLQADSLGISRSGERGATAVTRQRFFVAETPTPVTSPPAAAADLGDAGGALLAWQRPDPATPTSTLVAFPAMSLPAPTVVGAVVRASVPVLVLPTIRLLVDPPDGALTSLVSTTAAATTLPSQAAAASASIGTPSPAASASIGTPSPAPSPTVLATRVPAGATLAPGRRAAASTPTATPAPAAALAVAVPQQASSPALLNPALEDRRRGEVLFEWLPTGELPRNAAYEVVVWSPEQDPNQAWGVAPPTIMPSLALNLDELFRSGRFPTGNLFWTVLVVEQNPYRRLTQPADSEQRYLVYASDGVAAERLWRARFHYDS
jgi:hypothetical protein